MTVILFGMKFYESRYSFDYDLFTSYYETLGFEASPDADLVVIKKAWKALSLKWLSFLHFYFSDVNFLL